jgi:hypothetical protein
MANNFLQFSLSVPLKTLAEKSWCAETLTAFTTLLDLQGSDEDSEAQAKLVAQLGDLGKRVLDEGWYFASFEWSIDDANPKTTDSVAEVWISAEESGDPDQVVAFLQAYLQRFNPTGSLWFSWAYTCSKMRVNEFGGGAAVVRAAGTTFIDAQGWAQEQATAVAQSA